MTKETEALEVLKANEKKLDQLAQKTGFRKEKLFQWNKTKRLPSVKVARKILKVA